MKSHKPVGIVYECKRGQMPEDLCFYGFYEENGLLRSPTVRVAANRVAFDINAAYDCYRISTNNPNRFVWNNGECPKYWEYKNV